MERAFICKGRHPPDQLQIPKPPTLSFSVKLPRTEEERFLERNVHSPEISFWNERKTRTLELITPSGSKTRWHRLIRFREIRQNRVGLPSHQDGGETLGSKSRPCSSTYLSSSRMWNASRAPLPLSPRKQKGFSLLPTQLSFGQFSHAECVKLSHPIFPKSVLSQI